MTETLYKLTDDKDQTYAGCQWGEGVNHTADGQGELCSEHWIHAYRDPLLAVMMNPIHGNFDLASAHLWQCEAEVGADDGTKVGCTSLTTLARMELPVVTSEHRQRFGILCAMEVYHNDSFITWGDAWLSGKDRSPGAARAARAAAKAARAAVRAAAWAAAGAAAEAAAWAAEAEAKLDLVALAHKAVQA